MFYLRKTDIFIIFLFAIYSSILYSQQISKLTVNSKIKDIKPPTGFQRAKIIENSFAEWLRNLPLKPLKSPIVDYRGNIFKNKDDTTVAAVFDWEIKGKRFDQCMDILVRFYAEYLWEKGKQEQLTLPLPGKQSLKWIDWEKGLRPKFSGINFDLIKSEKYNSSKYNYDKFLNLVFAESHTQQFYYTYPAIKRQSVQVGDFIVKKGVKGHAVMIVDLARDTDGNLIALIGQGDTPACEFYLLNYKKDNPWIPVDFSNEIIPLPINKKMTWDGLRRFE